MRLNDGCVADKLKKNEFVKLVVSIQAVSEFMNAKMLMTAECPPPRALPDQWLM